MLYERWRQVARACSDQWALRDLATSEQWTFAQLAAATEQGGASNGHPVVFPQGTTADFIFAVLRAWRAQQVVCPLEPSSPPPHFSTRLPAGTAHLKLTSASTGAPRWVAFTAGQLMADAENLVATMGLRRDWPNLGVISLAHSYGFSNLVLPLLLHGVPLILPGGSLPEGVRRAAAAERAVTLPAVPALWRTWFEADALASSVRLAISAGAPLPLALEQSVFARHGLKIHNFYGSTECGGIAFDATPGPRLDAACAGAAVRNVNLSVAADGCMEVGGSAVGQTYWPEAEPNLGDGVFHTSDLADICFGLVYLRGRAGDQINIAGRKVAPEAIEKVLATHPGVRDCLAFGVPCPHGQRGENIVACLVPQGGVTEETLRQFLLARMPAWQVPRDWWFVESLDANARGKLPRADWRQRYLNRTNNSAHASDRSSVNGAMEENLKRS